MCRYNEDIDSAFIPQALSFQEAPPHLLGHRDRCCALQPCGDSCHGITVHTAFVYVDTEAGDVLQHDSTFHYFSVSS